MYVLVWSLTSDDSEISLWKIRWLAMLITSKLNPNYAQPYKISKYLFVLQHHLHIFPHLQLLFINICHLLHFICSHARCRWFSLSQNESLLPLLQVLCRDCYREYFVLTRGILNIVWPLRSNVCPFSIDFFLSFSFSLSPALHDPCTRKPDKPLLSSANAHVRMYIRFVDFLWSSIKRTVKREKGFWLFRPDLFFSTRLDKPAKSESERRDRNPYPSFGFPQNSHRACLHSAVPPWPSKQLYGCNIPSIGSIVSA